MVEINSQGQINSKEEELYLRVINEFRIEFENNILYFLNYIRTFEKTKINSEYLGYHLNYFNKLCARYHVKEIKLKINSEKENTQIDDILKIIKKAKKAIDYSFLDIADFYYNNLFCFLNFKISKNFAIILKQTLQEYNHFIPKKIIEAPEEIISNGKKQYFFSRNIAQNDFVNSLKNSIERAFLKVYDYLVETNEDINSRKMYFLKKDFVELGKKYHKIKFKVKINNKEPLKQKDLFLEEIASNLSRLKEIFN